MLADWFNKSLPDAPTVCLKLRLRDYCLGHEILLQKLNSPLVGDYSTISPKDLLISCLICSQTFEAARESLYSPWLGLYLRVWKLRLRKTNWHTEALKFVEYRTNGIWMPETCPPAKGRTLASPRQFRLGAQLMEHFHLSESEALNMPLVRAHMWYAARGDVEGTLHLYGDKEEAMSRKLDELEGRAE